MASPASSRTSTTLKPWSSGRILSPSQREAKRHKDRTTKRAKVEKQKDELEDIQSQIKHLQNLIHAHLGTKARFLHVDEPRDSASNILTWPLGSCVSSPPIDLPPSNSVSGSSSPHLPDPLCHMQDGVSTTEDAPPPVESPCDLIGPDWSSKTSSTPCTLSQPLLAEGSYTILQFINDLLLQLRQVGAGDICTNEQLNHDAIIRGVLGGWHTLRDMTYTCPLWKSLGQIDECLFMHSGILTRLSMLTMIHTMLVVRCSSGGLLTVPPFFKQFLLNLAILGSYSYRFVCVPSAMVSSKVNK